MVASCRSPMSRVESPCCSSLVICNLHHLVQEWTKEHSQGAKIHGLANFRFLVCVKTMCNHMIICICMSIYINIYTCKYAPKKNIWCTAVFVGLTLLVCVFNSRFATLCKYEAFLKPGYAPRLLHFTEEKPSLVYSINVTYTYIYQEIIFVLSIYLSDLI
jgi:hypothetical protein